MFVRILIFIFIGIGFSACITEPEVNEFTQIRQDMEKHRERMFARTQEDLANRKNGSTRTHRAVMDPEEELRLKQEEERQRWLAVDIDEEEAEDWKALNLSPKNALRWKKTGLSYNTIAVLIKEDVAPSEALAFMNKKFDNHPKAFAAFAEPLYQFRDACEKIINTKTKKLSVVKKECAEYAQFADFNSISGYLADEYQDNDLSLEYISKLRQLDSHKVYIQKLIEKEYQESMVAGDKQVFGLLFAMLETSPNKEEMYFVKKNRLPLKNTNRYKSYEYYDFWVQKEKSEERARVAAIKRQQQLKEAKKARLKAEAYRLKALAYNKMVASECGEAISSEPSTGEKVHLEGKVLHLIGKRGTNIFAYVIRNDKDGKNYLIRDPNGTKSFDIGSHISWSLITVGRVVSVSIDSDGTASYNHYEEGDDTTEFYPMLKFTQECKYQTMSLTE
jgi:hypothetical protein